MNVAYWCILIAALLPYLWATIAKSRGDDYDNNDPRGWMARQTDPRALRGHAAHLNAFEAFPAFAAAVLMAQAAGVAADRISLLAVLFVVCRVAHGLCYLADKGALRSLSWIGGIACVIALMVMAGLRVA